LNYAPINLLSTKRLNPSLINSFIEKLQFIVKICAKKKDTKLVNKKVPKNKTMQKKRVSNFNTNPKQIKKQQQHK